MVLVFDEWLGEIERRRPERAFARIKGSKDIMAGDIYDYEPWFRDGGGRGSLDICPPRAGLIWI